jgi:hypothetical protein
MDDEEYKDFFERGVEASKEFNNASFTERMTGTPGHTDGKSDWTDEQRDAYEDGKTSNGNRT